MDNPCRHCNKADANKHTIFKCDKPCKKAKDWYDCEKMLIDALSGKIRL